MNPRFALLFLFVLGACASSPKSPDSELRWSPGWAEYKAGDPQDDLRLEGLFISESKDRATNTTRLGLARGSSEHRKNPQIVVPTKYISIQALSSEEALVRYVKDGFDQLVILNFASGKERPIQVPDGFHNVERDWQRTAGLGWKWEQDGKRYYHNRIWIELESDEAGTRDVLLVEADGSTRAVVRGLRPLSGRHAFEILDDFGIVYDSDGAGAERSWIYTRDGELLAGPLPGIEQYALAATAHHPGFDVETLAMELVVRIGELGNEPDPAGDYKGRGLFARGPSQERLGRIAFGDPSIYAPLRADGTLAELPQGVVGLMRLVTHVPDRREGRWYDYRPDVEHEDAYHSGWAVLFGTEEGRRQFGFALGTTEEALAAAPGLVRYDAWEQGNYFQHDFDGSWQPARIFAKRASDGEWEALDIESMRPYGMEAYGDNLAWGEPLTSSYLSSLKMMAFDVYDSTGASRATERWNRDLDEAAAEREREAARLAQANGERLDQVYAYISAGRATDARRILVDWDLGAGEPAAWATYYRTFGCRGPYELQHAREMGVDETTLAALQDIYEMLDAEQAASDAAQREQAAREAAWAQALRFKPTIERVEVDYSPNGTARIRRYKVPL